MGSKNIGFSINILSNYFFSSCHTPLNRNPNSDLFSSIESGIKDIALHQ